jgi:hypothetical protein
MNFQFSCSFEPALILLLKQTTLGTNGAKYRHLDIEERIQLADNPLSFSLKRNESLIANITFCKREHALYLRYFAFDKRFQGTGEKKPNSRNSGLKGKIEEVFKELEFKENKCCYAYIDPKNTRSKWMSQQFGFKSRGTIATQAFSRFYPKKSVRLKIINDFNEISELVRQQYEKHQFYFEAQSGKPDFLGLKNDSDQIIALAKFTKVHWEINRLPGKWGGVVAKILPFIPLLNKLIHPKSHQFIVPEIVCIPSNKSEHLEELFSSALAHFNVNSLLWWVDEKDSVYKEFRSKVKWGFLDKMLGVSPVDIVVRGALKETDSPFFVCAFDMI